MPTSRPHLLLPSPQGLLHYDVVEETVFLGPAGRGGLHGAPQPFPEAQAVIRAGGGRFTVHALPGEALPEVDGTPGDGVALVDGARIRIAERVALFRWPGGGAVAPAPSASARAPRPTAAPTDRTDRNRRATQALAPPGAQQAGRLLLFGGLGVLGLAAFQSIGYLQTPGGRAVQRVTPEMTALTEPLIARNEVAAAAAFAAAADHEARAPADLEGAVARYASVARAHPSTAAAERAAARVKEVWPALAASVWKETRQVAMVAANQARYRRAVEAIDLFDAKFSGTPASSEAAALRGELRTAARAALDAVAQRAAPLFSTNPTRAYQVLYGANLELPPDLEAELAGLLAAARARWDDPPTGAPGGGDRPPRRPDDPPRDPPRDPTVGPDRRAPQPPPDDPTGAPPPGDVEAAASTTWRAAHEALAAGRYSDARRGFDALLGTLRTTKVVREHEAAIRTGRRAADVGERGPAAFCSEEATWRGGRLTAEWTFDNDRGFREDFELLDPFGGEQSIAVECRDGMVVLGGSATLLFKAVFDPDDVEWEMEGFSDVEPADLGLLGLQDGKAYRACAMHVGNTQFRLKKGAAAKVLAGHVVWLFGDGVWKDADAGERGFVRVAVRDGNRLKAREKVRVRAELHRGQMTGEIHAKSDAVDLKGPLKGDDGVGIGPLRVGPFVHGGRFGVERFRVSGKVDAAWFARELEALVAAAAAPR